MLFNALSLLFFHLPGCITRRCLILLNKRNTRYYCCLTIYQAIILICCPSLFLSQLHLLDRWEHTVGLCVIFECFVKISPMHTLMHVNFSIINKSYFPTWVLNHGWNHRVLTESSSMTDSLCELSADYLTCQSALTVKLEIFDLSV